MFQKSDWDKLIRELGDPATLDSGLGGDVTVIIIVIIYKNIILLV